MDGLASILFVSPEGSSVDDVALSFDRNDSPAEQKVALILVVVFLVCHSPMYLNFYLEQSPYPREL